MDKIQAQMQKQFRDRLAELAEEKNIAYAELSRQIGQSKSYIQGILSEKFLPTFRAFFDICQVLEVTPEEFFSYCSSDEKTTQIMKKLYKPSDEDKKHIDEIVNTFVKRKSK